MIRTGTIMEIKNSKAYVFTDTCEFLPIRAKKEYILGQQIHFADKDVFVGNTVLQLKSFRILVAAVLLVLIAGSILLSRMSFGPGSFDTACVAVVSVDINPSIEMSVNKDYRVIGIVYSNADGAALSKELDLRTKTVPDALSQIVDLAAKKGFLDASRIVLVTGAPNTAEADRTYGDQLRSILGGLEKKIGPEIITAYISDTQIIGDAKSNDTSIGKMVLFKYAANNGYSISLQEVKNSTVSDILGKLNVSGTDVSLETPPPSPSPSPAPAASPNPSPSPSLSPPSPSPSPSPSPAQVNTPEPSAAPEPGFTPMLSAWVSDGKISFSWTPVDGDITYNGKYFEDFSFYKVVASADNPTPVYPDDGYLCYVSDTGASSWTVDPASGDYNHSPKLESGRKYYFAVTYVYGNGKFTSNTVTLTVPSYSSGSKNNAPVFSLPQLSASVSGGALHFSWSALPGKSVTCNGKLYSDFNYYKVVASATDSTPVYPDNGYLYYTSDPGSSSWDVDPGSDGYNQSPKLEAGKTYYFAITYVFSSGKFVSNTVTLKVPDYGVPAAAAFSSPNLNVSSSGGKLVFSWTPLPAASVSYDGISYENFNYYKVVASETNPNPIYPDDGYLTYNSALSASSWSVDPSGSGYNKSPALERGKTYYFAITYVFSNGKFVSNTVQYTVPTA